MAAAIFKACRMLLSVWPTRLLAVGHFAFFRGDTPGQFLQLVAAGQFMLDHHHLLFEVGGDLDQGRQDGDKRAVLLALRDLPLQGLDDLGGVHEPVEVLQDQEGRAIGTGQGVDGLNGTPSPLTSPLNSRCVPWTGDGKRRRWQAARTALASRTSVLMVTMWLIVLSWNDIARVARNPSGTPFKRQVL